MNKQGHKTMTDNCECCGQFVAISQETGLCQSCQEEQDKTKAQYGKQKEGENGC